MDPLLEVFVYENMQLLEQIESTLLTREKNAPLTKAQIDEVFRVMHTLKGSSAMMEYNNMAKLAHGVEDLFDVVRSNGVDPTLWEDILDLILHCIDFFKNELTKVQEGLLPDGEIGMLYDQKEELLSKLSGSVVSVAPQAQRTLVMPGDASSAPATPIATVSAKAPADKAASKPTKAAAVAAKAAKVESVPAEPVPVKAAAAKAQPVELAPVELAPIDLMPDSDLEEQFAQEMGYAVEEGVRFYRAAVRFEKDCGMETIRAFGIVNTLKKQCQAIKHVPANIDANVDDEIVRKGFLILMASSAPASQLESTIKSTILVKSVEFNPIDQSRFSLKEEINVPSAPQAPVAEAAGEFAFEKHIKQNFISVDVNRIDKLMNLVGEIVTSESMVVKNPEVAKLHLEGFEKQARLLRKLTTELQDVVMSIRMVPVSSNFLKMQRLVRDMSKKVGKDVKFVMIGEKTEVDKNVNDLLADPLMHLVRNCMDHGLETRDERIAAGKSPVGTITLMARNTGGDIIVTVSDDGRGLNKQAIVKKAIEKGLTKKNPAEISDKEAFRFILSSGFSTKESVTEYSGRGVGMDVVRENIEKIGGSIYIESEKGQGSKFIMRIPLTLAIINGMKVVVGAEQYIIPILNIRESFEPRLHKCITSPDGVEMVIIRGQCYRVVRLHEKFNVPTEVTDFKKGIMIMVESELGRACLFVDKLVDEQQVVIKPIPPNIAKVVGRSMGIAGCTIMGDGGISLILDVNGLLSVNRQDVMNG